MRNIVKGSLFGVDMGEVVFISRSQVGETYYIYFVLKNNSVPVSVSYSKKEERDNNYDIFNSSWGN